MRGLVAFAIDPVDLGGVERRLVEVSLASCGSCSFAHGERRSGARLVRRVVENLDIQLLARVVNPRDVLEEARRDSGLVVERELNGDVRNARERRLRAERRNLVLHGAERARVQETGDREMRPMDAYIARKPRTVEMARRARDACSRAKHPAPPALSPTCNSLHAFVRKTQARRLLEPPRYGLGSDGLDGGIAEGLVSGAPYSLLREVNERRETEEHEDMRVGVVDRPVFDDPAVIVPARACGGELAGRDGQLGHEAHPASNIDLDSEAERPFPPPYVALAPAWPFEGWALKSTHR